MVGITSPSTEAKWLFGSERGVVTGTWSAGAAQGLNRIGGSYAMRFKRSPCGDRPYAHVRVVGRTARR